MKVRAGNLQDLVYKGGQAGVTRATVTITFDNSDSRQSPLGYETYEEITVSRQVLFHPSLSSPSRPIYRLLGVESLSLSSYPSLSPSPLPFLDFSLFSSVCQ